MLDKDLRSSASRPRILLVDDTEINRDVIGRILTNAGYDVEVVSNGEDACAVTWTKCFDLVLMDVEMPRMNGFEAAARIRAREGVISGVKIAALTATVQPDAEQYSFWSGIDEFIAKPIDPKLFLHRVSELVAGGGSNIDDWKPVWRLGVFSKVTGDEDADNYLDEMLALMASAETAIDARRSCTSGFFQTVRELRHMSQLLGFEEIDGICALYADTPLQKDARSRDPNLLGGIDRARYAIDVFRQDRHPSPPAGWWTKTRVNVRSLFRGPLQRAVATATASTY